MTLSAPARLRSICLALPEADERLSHGEPSWFAAKKMFVTLSDHHHDDRLAFWCAAPAGVQEHLVATDPVHFFRPPYVGHRGWIGVYLDVAVDWTGVKDLVLDAHCLVAPARLTAAPADGARTGCEMTGRGHDRSGTLDTHGAGP
ncbi:MmcQ/YjbR family DNA-binding protein [Streptomyces sp. NPDC002668]|uniref:MmcQ/YjbR family DNA-binding protein n=1 Tax=Streptomyces sp. NPDC002668 TaxID=3154422 RepID=UPI00332FB1F7